MRWQTSNENNTVYQGVNQGVNVSRYIEFNYCYFGSYIINNDSEIYNIALISDDSSFLNKMVTVSTYL